MSRILGGTRYLVVIPVIGLAIAAAVFFVFGGIGLIRLLIETDHRSDLQPYPTNPWHG